MLTPAQQSLLDRLHRSLDHELGVASDKSAERDLDRRSEPRSREYSNIEPNTGLRRYGPI